MIHSKLNYQSSYNLVSYGNKALNIGHDTDHQEADEQHISSNSSKLNRIEEVIHSMEEFKVTITWLGKELYL